MKVGTVRRIVNWIASAVIFTGIAYSGLALRAKPVYASSCTCTEELQDAHVFCFERYGNNFVSDFQCPVGGSAYLFFCSADPSQEWGFPCD